MSLNWYATRRTENVSAGKVEEKVAQKVQLCSTEGCERQSAFTGRKKDARCEECLAGILADVDLEPLEAFPGTSKKWWLTRCRTCKAECHYRLETLLEKLAIRDTGCARCHWAEWAKLHGGDSDPVSVGAQQQLLDENGFDPLGELSPLLPGHAVLTKCRACGNQAARRIADLSWGCHCTRVTRTGGVGTRKEDGAKRGARNLFVDSDSPALSWWDHEENPEAEFKTVTVKATREADWICPDCDNRFPEKIFIMAQSPRCPACLEVRRTEYDRLRTVPVSDVPALLIAWDDEDADPREVMVVGGEGTLRRFICNAGHHPRMNPYAFLMDGCSICRGLATRKQNGLQTLATALPEIAAQWHPTRNGNRTPENVSPNSTKSFVWKAACCGHEWEDSVRNRDKYQRWLCPKCRTILHSFGWQDPGLAAEWSPENPTTPWHLRPFAQTNFLPQWICSVNPEHQWEAPLASRSSGTECRECQVVGKSKIELEHFEAARKVFTKVRSGVAVRDKAFETRTAWSLDILVEHDGTRIAIEYDGAYWHRPEAKVLADRSKSLDLLAAGYLVIRLREDDLPPLDINDPRYGELRVYSAAPQPQKMIAEADEWYRRVITSSAVPE